MLINPSSSGISSFRWTDCLDQVLLKLTTYLLDPDVYSSLFSLISQFHPTHSYHSFFFLYLTRIYLYIFYHSRIYHDKLQYNLCSVLHIPSIYKDKNIKINYVQLIYSLLSSIYELLQISSKEYKRQGIESQYIEVSSNRSNNSSSFDLSDNLIHIQNHNSSISSVTNTDEEFSPTFAKSSLRPRNSIYSSDDLYSIMTSSANLSNAPTNNTLYNNMSGTLFSTTNNRELNNIRNSVTSRDLLGTSLFSVSSNNHCTSGQYKTDDEMNEIEGIDMNKEEEEGYRYIYDNIYRGEGEILPTMVYMNQFDRIINQEKGEKSSDETTRSNSIPSQQTNSEGTKSTPETSELLAASFDTKDIRMFWLMALTE